MICNNCKHEIDVEDNPVNKIICPRCGANANEKQNILLNIFSFVFNVLAWIVYLFLRKKHPQMAEGCVLWGLIGSAVSFLGIWGTTGKVNPFCIIMCIIYYVLWRRA